MITKDDRLINRITGCLRFDRKASTVVHVEIDKIIQFLHEFDYMVPAAQFEQLVTTVLNEYVVNKLPAGEKPSLHVIANFILDVGKAMHISKRDIALFEKNRILAKANADLPDKS